MELTLDQSLQKGIEAHKAGQVQEADRLYTAILKAQPKHPDANHNMGVLAVGVGKVQEALPFFKTALEANPDTAQFWLSYMNALIKLKRLEDAKAVLDQAKSNGAKGDGFDQLKQRLEGVKPSNNTVSQYQDPPEDQLQPLIGLYSQGQLQQALDEASQLLQKFSKSVALFNIIGASNKGLGRLDAAIEAYNKVLAIKPDYAEAYYNMGVTLQEQGKLEKAIEAYNKALAIKPDYAKAYSNMGVTLKEQCKLEEAIESYNKALAIKPDYADAYSNMGNALREQGKLEEAIEAYNKALAIKPDYARVIENSQSLAVQLLPSISICGYEFYKTDTQVNSKITLRPKYQIQNAIKAFLETDFSKAHSHNNNFKACEKKLLDKQQPQDKLFCSAYSNFLEKLLETNWNNAPVSETENKVYHLGESHCLSYAHQNITIDGSNFRIAPRITFGAKAFHLSRKKDNGFKAITKANFASIPKCSKVFLSFGEIDCRPNEGFISAAEKLNKPLEQPVTETVLGYVQWFLEQNEGQNHRLYFINVPAPVYDKKLTADLNSEVARTVSLFNAALEKYTLQHSLYMVDVFQFTVRNDGFSNGLFHVDKAHLGAKAIPKIEQQLN